MDPVEPPGGRRARVVLQRTGSPEGGRPPWRGSGPRRRRWGLDWFTIAVLAFVVVGLAVAGWTLLGREPRFREPQPRLGSLGIATSTYIEQWNQVVDTGAGGVRLGNPTFERDPAIELDVASQPVGSWGVVELYRTPGNEIASVLVLGTPDAPEEHRAFHALAVAAVAAATGQLPEDATTVLGRDLGIAPDGGGLGASTVTIGGVRLETTRTASSVHLTITSG